jgi:hypothetical protein
MEQEEAWLNIIKDLYLKTRKVGLIPLSAFRILESEIDLTEEEWQMIARQTENRMQFEAAREGTKSLKELAHLKGSSLYPKTLADECKRQAIANYFTKQHEMENF